MLCRTIQKIRAALNELCRPGVGLHLAQLVECQGGVLDVCRDRECKGLRDGEVVREDLATDWVLSRLPCTDVELVRPDADQRWSYTTRFPGNPGPRGTNRAAPRDDPCCNRTRAATRAALQVQGGRRNVLMVLVLSFLYLSEVGRMRFCWSWDRRCWRGWKAQGVNCGSLYAFL